MTLTQMANMFLTFAIVLNSEFGSGSVTSYALNAIYLTITAIQFIYALGNDPRDNKEVYQICYIFYGTLFLFTMFCSFSIPSLIASNVLHDDNSRCVRALCRVCLFFRHNRLFDRSRTVLRDYPHYDSISVSFSTCVESRFMLPTFMNIFIIYSFCNVHDVTWGTRDSNLINNEKAQHDMEVSYRLFAPTTLVTSDFDRNSWCSGRLPTSSTPAAFFWFPFCFSLNAVQRCVRLRSDSDCDYRNSFRLSIRGVRRLSSLFLCLCCEEIIRLSKYFQKYHGKSGRRRLFKTIAVDPNYRKKAYYRLASNIIGCKWPKKSGG